MSSYNGERYIQEQLNSIFNQKNVDVYLYIRDDGSSDNTISILNKYKSSNFQYYKGRNLGAKRSFMEAIRNAPIADYYALADQDDVWDSDKLFLAVNNLKDITDDLPLLYCSALRVVDEKLRTIAPVSGKNRKYSFLCGNITPAAGCTMVFNRRLKEELCKYEPVSYPMHDYWILLICLALGGEVHYDPYPHMAYRQHLNNTVGGKRNILMSLKRRINFYRDMGPNYHTKMYEEILNAYSKDMPSENVDFCKMICRCNKSLNDKVLLLHNRNFWKGTFKHKVETLFLLVTGMY